MNFPSPFFMPRSQVPHIRKSCAVYLLVPMVGNWWSLAHAAVILI